MPASPANFFIKTLLNSPFHPLLGKGYAVITVTGRKTGRDISTPVNPVQLGNTITIISTRERTWWRNLRQGQTASLKWSGKTLNLRGKVLESKEDVTGALEKYFEQYPGHAKYFKVACDQDGKLDPRALERLADERIIVQLVPV